MSMNFTYFIVGFLQCPVSLYQKKLFYVLGMLWKAYLFACKGILKY